MVGWSLTCTHTYNQPGIYYPKITENVLKSSCDPDDIFGNPGRCYQTLSNPVYDFEFNVLTWASDVDVDGSQPTANRTGHHHHHCSVPITSSLPYNILFFLALVCCALCYRRIG